MLHTNYKQTILSDAAADLGTLPLSYSEAVTLCRDRGGDIASIHSNLLTVLYDYLLLWRHSPSLGDIWGSMEEGDVNIIEVGCVRNPYLCRTRTYM